MIVLDLETVPLDTASDYVPPPDLESIQAARNLRDPIKIQEDVAKRRAEAVASHAEKLGKAALDFNLARIVALGWSHDGGDITVALADTEDAESNLLERFWGEIGSHRGKDYGVCDASLVGYNARCFDIPMLMSRSRFLGVRYPSFDLGRFARNSRVIDLMDTLLFGLSSYDITKVMPLTLKTVARRWGIEVTDPYDGSQIGELVAAGNWDAVIAHVTSDVRLTAQLAQRLGVLAGVAA